MFISAVNFYGKPDNYGVIDKYLSRSAQPEPEDFKWLKEHGVSDVINFRTMIEPGSEISEKETVEALNMKYHHIPSYTRSPDEKNIKTFLDTMENIISNNGKAHIHCKAGADRTGMYAFIYKMLKGIGTLEQNKKEWLDFGHHYKLYPDLIGWTEEFVRNIQKSL